MHTILLGPGNAAFKKLEELADINRFKVKHHLRGSGPGGDLNGPAIKKIVNSDENLDELKESIPVELDSIVDHLKLIGEVNKVATSKTLDIDKAKLVLSKFRMNFYYIQEKFDLSESLKIHIINDHLEDYFELTGETLLTASDEITEATHSKLRKFEERHKYKINMIGSPAHKNYQHRSTVHFNSCNLKAF